MVTKLVMILAVAMTALARLGGAVPFLDKKVLEIASAVGMSNVDYSQTAFKRYFGVTPRTYRQQARDA